MNKLLFFSLLIIFYVCTVKSYAQDPHFSQYYASPMTLNPAFTGKFEGETRMSANYRNQWPTIDRAYQTMAFAVDMPILRNVLDERDRMGIGFMGYSDKSAQGALNFNYFSFSTAFQKGLDEDGLQQIGLGLQATYANQLINTSKLQFADQLTPFGFTNVSSENFDNATLRNHYFDMNAGLLYTYSSNEENNYYFGVSGYHLNRPRQQFTLATYQVDPRYTFHGGAYFPVNDELSLHLSAMHSMQSKSNETLAGGALQFNLSESAKAENSPTNFYAGGWYRFGDALIPYVGLEYNNFKIGVTYDINSSSLKTASQSQGGFELSLQYIFKNNNKGYTPCPKY